MQISREYCPDISVMPGQYIVATGHTVPESKSLIAVNQVWICSTPKRVKLVSSF
jgi:hypothetical protein